MQQKTNAAFLALLAAQQQKATQANTPRPKGQPAAPKQATPPPTPKPAPAPVVKSPLKSFTILWHEGTGEFDGHTFNTWYEANKAMTEICRAHGYNQGYSKVKICVKWENGEEMTDRADCGKNSAGDFDSDRETIAQYLERSRSVMYSRTFATRENLSFEDSPEALKAAIIAEQTTAAKKDTASEAARPELSTVTTAQLLGNYNSQPLQPKPAPTPAAPRLTLQKVAAVMPTAASTTAPEVAAATEPELFVIDYSPKSFAVFGKTKENRETLYSLGGSFNAYLKHNGKTRPGYIFSNRHRDKVRSALGI